MKVRGFVFSGFMSAILMSAVSAANAATASVNLASKNYVDTALSGKQDSLTAGEGIGIEGNVIRSTIDTTQFAKKDEIPGLSMFVTHDELAEELKGVKKALQDEIDAKHQAGDYATAAQLQELERKVDSLPSGGVDEQVINELRTAVETITEDYAKKAELTATEKELRDAIAAINFPSLEEYAKTQDVAATYATKSSLSDYVLASALKPVATSGSYNDLTDKPTIPDVADLVTSQQLVDLQTALQDAIDEKQAKGDYAAAADLAQLQEEVAALKAGGSTDGGAVDTSALEARIKTIEDTYATDAELTEAIDAVKALIPSTDGFIPQPAKSPDTNHYYFLQVRCISGRCQYSWEKVDSLTAGGSNVGDI